jgi:hypothetical protein
LKGVLVQVQYAKDQHEYVAQTTGQTIMFPAAAKYFENFFAIIKKCALKEKPF